MREKLHYSNKIKQIFLFSNVQNNKQPLNLTNNGDLHCPTPSPMLLGQKSTPETPCRKPKVEA
jgi:hypothetical protein